MITRFALLFAAGAVLHQYQDMIPARWSLVAVSAAVVVVAGLLVHNYRIVAAIPLAYAVVVSGALIHQKRLRLRTDLSYGVYIYAWPLQQLLVICGLGFLPPFAFAVVAAAATLPLAAMSWFLVEKRALSLKARFKRKARAGTAGVADAQPRAHRLRRLSRRSRAIKSSWISRREISISPLPRAIKGVPVGGLPPTNASC